MESEGELVLPQDASIKTVTILFLRRVEAQKLVLVYWNGWVEGYGDEGGGTTTR